MILTSITCTACGHDDIISIQPGAEPLSSVGITYARGAPDTAWCHHCYWARFGADLFSATPEPESERGGLRAPEPMRTKMARELRMSVVIPLPDDVFEEAKLISTSGEIIKKFRGDLTAAIPDAEVKLDVVTPKVRSGKDVTEESAPATAAPVETLPLRGGRGHSAEQGAAREIPGAKSSTGFDASPVDRHPDHAAA